MANISRVERLIRQKIPEGSCVRLGGMADPLQKVEETERMTLEVMKLLNRHRIHYLLVTKSPLVGSKDYMEAMDKDLAHVQVSVTCLDNRRARMYEKGAPPSKRIEAVLRLQQAGFDVALRISPLVEELLDFTALNNIRVKKCLVEFLRVNAFIKKAFPGVDYEKYTVWQSNYWHLPLDEKCRLLEKIHLPNVSVCEDVTEHYVFWKKYFNTNSRDCCNLRMGTTEPRSLERMR